MTFSRQVLSFIALAGFAAGAAGATPPAAPVYSAHYSFADVYRLTVGDAMAEYAPAQAPAAPAIKVVAADAKMSASTGSSIPPAGSSAAGGYEFSASTIPQPSRWLLLLSGLALAGWVARRRLGYAN